MAQPRFLIDKSPAYALDWRTLEHAESLFDGAKYIHLTRHPYAAIESFVRNRFEKLLGVGYVDSAALAQEIWLTSNQYLCDIGNRVGPERYHRVYYEKLVRDPEPVMRRLCAFLGVPFDTAVLRPYEGRRMTDGVHAKSLAVGDPNFLQHTGIEVSLGDAWRRVRPPIDLNERARRVATTLQYELLPENNAMEDGRI